MKVGPYNLACLFFEFICHSLYKEVQDVTFVKNPQLWELNPSFIKQKGSVE